MRYTECYWGGGGSQRGCFDMATWLDICLTTHVLLALHDWQQGRVEGTLGTLHHLWTKRNVIIHCVILRVSLAI